MHPALLAMIALLAIGLGAWTILKELAAAIIPDVAAPGHRSPDTLAKVQLLITVAYGLWIAFVGARALGQLAVSP